MSLGTIHSGTRIARKAFLTILTLAVVGCGGEQDPLLVTESSCKKAIAKQFNATDVKVGAIKQGWEFDRYETIAEARQKNGETIRVYCSSRVSALAVDILYRISIEGEMAMAIRDFDDAAVKRIIDLGYCRDYNCSIEIARLFEKSAYSMEKKNKRLAVFEHLLRSTTDLQEIGERKDEHVLPAGMDLLSYILRERPEYAEVEMFFRYANASIIEKHIEAIVAVSGIQGAWEPSQFTLTDDQSLRLLQIAESRGAEFASVSEDVVSTAVIFDKPKVLDYLLLKNAPFDANGILFTYASAADVSDLVFRRLISAGANPHAKNHMGLNALEWALYGGKSIKQDGLAAQFNSVNVFANEKRVQVAASEYRRKAAIKARENEQFEQGSREGCIRLAQRWNEVFLRGLAGESIAPSEDVQVPPFCRKYLE